MIVFPNGKINLGLSVLNKRADGFHNIESILYPVPIYDALEFQPSDQFSIEVFGIDIPGNTEDNILFKTWKLLHDDLQIPPINIKLLKGIPLGSGLGGGSSDAVYFLKSMNNYFELALPTEILLDYAASLGSDCPFFIENVASIVSGRGEIIEPLELSLEGMHIAVVCPEIAISTKEAFEETATGKPEKHIKDIINEPIADWQDKLLNNFEKTAFKKYPSLQKIKNTLLNAGAVYASLTGSGAAVYGLFRESVHIKKYFPDEIVWEGILK
jgi:4-diphosphocytidyl-2-C-methyl-D-erythritol kinase